MANPYVDALAGNSWLEAGFDNHVTYYFDNTGSRSWTEAEKDGFRAALQSWVNVANITFEEVATEAEAEMVESLALTSSLAQLFGSGTLAIHTSPDTESTAGVFAADGSVFSNPYAIGNGPLVAGSYSFQTLVHEIGHALGLAHPHDNGQGTTLFPGVYDANDKGNYSENQDVYTVMSYNSYEGSSQRGISTGNVAGPMAFDIAAIQQLYGTKAAEIGNNVYSLEAVTGANAKYLCLWDTGGIDTISYSGTESCVIRLQAATLSPPNSPGGLLSGVGTGFNGLNSGGYAIAWGVVVEHASGGSGHDELYGNGARNVLRGGAGSDQLFGGGGVDLLIGGTGDDFYWLENSFDSVVEYSGGGVDLIYTSVSRSLVPYSNIEGITLVLGTNINAVGNDLNNTIQGNSGNNVLLGLGGNDAIYSWGGSDFIDGGLGNDTLVADLGRQLLTGGAGADDFIFISGGMGRTATTRDIIKDFTHLHDDIDLLNIDANIKVAGNQAFKFLATKGAAFTGVAGQLHWFQINPAGTTGDRTIIEGDINGDKVADFQIELTGLKVLTAADFIL